MSLQDSLSTPGTSEFSLQGLHHPVSSNYSSPLVGHSSTTFLRCLVFLRFLGTGVRVRESSRDAVRTSRVRHRLLSLIRLGDGVSVPTTLWFTFGGRQFRFHSKCKIEATSVWDWCGPTPHLSLRIRPGPKDGLELERLYLGGELMYPMSVISKSVTKDSNTTLRP